ncbi:MAG: hypothetical protein KDD28_26630, partial [Phaeodactylibacter sp.]|nr:hypothetical protein [Phaeodactylibacter sp.]
VSESDHIFVCFLLPEPPVRLVVAVGAGAYGSGLWEPGSLEAIGWFTIAGMNDFQLLFTLERSRLVPNLQLS